MKKYSKISFAAALCLVISLFAGCLTGFAATPEVIPVDSYADVGETHWAYPWVTFMTNEGYIHGYPTEENDGQELYKPDQLITRAEFVTILYRYTAHAGLTVPATNRGNYPTDRRADEVTPWIEAFVNARLWVENQK